MQVASLLVRETGLEPVRPCGHRILSPIQGARHCNALQWCSLPHASKYFSFQDFSQFLHGTPLPFIAHRFNLLPEKWGRKWGRFMMVQIVTNHDASWCFGTRLAPRWGCPVVLRESRQLSSLSIAVDVGGMIVQFCILVSLSVGEMLVLVKTKDSNSILLQIGWNINLHSCVWHKLMFD